MKRGRALVLGAGGFLGGHVARALVAEGWQVVGQRRPGGSTWRLGALPAEMDLEELELGRDRAALELLIARLAPQLVVQAAVHGAYGERDLVAGVETDLLGLAHLLAALPAQGCRLLMFGSSLAVAPSGEKIGNAAPLGPTSTRGTLRAAASLLVFDEVRARRLEAGVLRIFSVYGPWEEKHRLVPKAIAAALAGQPLPLTAPPWPTHDFVFAEDVAEACLVAARAAAFPGATWNVCSGRPVSDAELVDTVEKVVGRPIERQIGAWRSRHPERLFWCGDPQGSAAGLGWRARFSLEEGLAITAEWIKGQRGH